MLESDARLLFAELDAERPFDFVFIDADNSNYPIYLDFVLNNIRPEGLIAAHNAFVRGAILNESNLGAYVEGTRIFNRRIANDPCLIATIYPAGDGIIVAILRE